MRAERLLIIRAVDATGKGSSSRRIELEEVSDHGRLLLIRFKTLAATTDWYRGF